MTIDTTKLIGGPYPAPDVQKGDWLHDERWGQVVVGGWTDAPIPWPRLKKTGTHSPILTGALVDAVRIESVAAICHHWSVSPGTVAAWRKALGVERVNPGTRRLYEEYKPIKLTPDVVAKGRKNALKPEAIAKNVAAHKTLPLHENFIRARKEAAARTKSKKWKQTHSERMRREWADGTRQNPNEWDEEALATVKAMTLDGASDADISKATGRSVPACRYARRLVVGITKRVIHETTWDEVHANRAEEALRKLRARIINKVNNERT